MEVVGWEGQSLQHGQEGFDLVLDLAPVGPAVSASSGAALEKLLEEGGSADLAED